VYPKFVTNGSYPFTARRVSKVCPQLWTGVWTDLVAGAGTSDVT